MRGGLRHVRQGRTTEGSHSAYTARRIGAASVERSVPALKRKQSQTPQQMGGPASASPAARQSGGGGGVQGVNVIILVLVAASVVIAAGLLAETVNTARAIDKKAKSIRDTGIGINTATDSISQLQRTNRIATSILKTATPLEGVLTKIDNRAKSINRDATSIDSLASTILSTAGTINTSATTIGGTATDINNTAGTINTTAGSIDEIAGGIRSHVEAARRKERASSGAEVGAVVDHEDTPHPGIVPPWSEPRIVASHDRHGSSRAAHLDAAEPGDS